MAHRPPPQRTPPLSGPRMDPTATAPTQLARDAAQAIRECNHLTCPRPDQTPALPYPANAYDAISALKTLAQRLPQASEQIGTALDVLFFFKQKTAYEMRT